MTVTVVRHSINGTTSGAPSLTGQAGSLIAVLDFCLVTTLGWTKDYSGTNLASYRQPVGTSNRMYLGVDDTSGTNGRVRGFEAMTAAGVAVGSGTNPFPTDVQVSGGLYFAKSGSGDATARPYCFVSNGKCFYLISLPSGTGSAGTGMFFGDFKPYLSSDAYNVALISDTGGQALSTITSANNTVAANYVARPYTQVAGSLYAGKWAMNDRTNSSYLGGGGATYPAPIGGGLLVSPVCMTEGSSAVASGPRGELPGLYNPLHQRPLAAGDTYSGTGALAGKTFEVFNLYSTVAQIHLEVSNTWEAY